MADPIQLTFTREDADAFKRWQEQQRTAQATQSTGLTPGQSSTAEILVRPSELDTSELAGG